MSKKPLLFFVILALVLGSVSVAAADTPTLKNQSFENYSFSYNYTTSTVYNLSYSTDSSNVLMAKQISVSGTALSSALTDLEDLKAVQLQNGTILSGGEMNSLLIATKGTSSISFNLSAPIAKYSSSSTLNLGSSVYTYIGTTSVSQISMNVYAVYISSQNGSFYGYLVSNGQASLSNDNTTATFTHSSPLGALLAGFVSNGNIKDAMQKYFDSHHNFERLTFNSTTGVASGRFLSFDFNQSTGVMNNFTSLLSNQKVFNSINASGNGTFGVGEDLPSFAFGQPTVMGSVFFFANNSYIYAVHNNPSLQSNFWINNGTIVFNVSNGLHIHEFATAGQNSQYNQTQLVSNTSVASNDVLGADHEVEPGKTAIYLSSVSFTGFLLVNNGNVVVNTTTGLVTVSSNHTAKITFVSPPGIQGNSAVEQAILKGSVGGQFLIENNNGSLSDMSVSYNSSLKMSLVSNSSGKVVLRVSSAHHEGTNVVVFVSNAILSGSSKIYVSLDNQSIQLTSINDTLNVTSSVQAYYSVINEQNGFLVVIHVPHFSNHTIEISTTPFTTGSTPKIPLSPQMELALGIIAVIAIVAIALAVVRRRK